MRPVRSAVVSSAPCTDTALETFAVHADAFAGSMRESGSNEVISRNASVATAITDCDTEASDSVATFNAWGNTGESSSMSGAARSVTMQVCR